jgi:hypothetical protein
MAELRIDYQGKAFWTEECFIELLSKYICQTFENIGLNTFNASLMNIYMDCDGNRSGVCVGYVNILFNENITNNTDKTTLINILNQTKTIVLSLGTTISVAQLNQFEDSKEDPVFANYWVYPVQTQSLASLLDLFIDLLNGTYPISNGSVHFSGFPIIPGATII